MSESGSNRAVLRVWGQGQVAVSEVRGCLGALEHAYEGIAAFDYYVDYLRRYRDVFVAPYPYWPPLALSNPLLLGWFESVESRRSEGAGTGAILPPDDLELYRVELGSPGFWEFLGTLNLLETIRKTLNDIDESRRRRLHKDAAEAKQLQLENERRRIENERLVLQNEELANAVLRGRLENARLAGLTQQEISSLYYRFVGQPYRELEGYQDRGVIGVAEIVENPAAA